MQRQDHPAHLLRYDRPMQLHGSRCTLRPWREEDLASLVRHADNRKVWLGLADRFPHPYTEEDARSWIDRCRREELPALNLAIEVDGEAIGGCGIEPWKGNFRRTGEIGYWLGEELWGRGIATEAVGLHPPWLRRPRLPAHPGPRLGQQPGLRPRAREERLRPRGHHAPCRGQGRLRSGRLALRQGRRRGYRFLTTRS